MGKILHSLMMLVLPVLITFLIGLVVSYNQDQCYDILKRMLDLELELRMKALNEDQCNIIISVITFIKQFRNKLFFLNIVY